MHRSEAIEKAQILLMNADTILMDTETTGLSSKDQVIEIAAINTKGEVLVGQPVKRFKPTVPINPAAQVVHGISMEDLENCPSFVEFESINQLFVGKILVAYNAKFDKRLLNQSIAAHNLNLIPHQWVCLLEMNKAAFPEKAHHKLGGDHSALGDLYASLEVLKSIANLSIEPITQIPTLSTQDFYLSNMVDDLVGLKTEVDLLSTRKKELELLITTIMTAQKVSVLNGSCDNKVMHCSRKTVKLKSGHSIEEVPNEYVSIKLDTSAIRAALEKGLLIPGIELEENTYLKMVQANEH